MLTFAAYGLAIVLSVFCAYIGALFLLRPVASAAGYGVPSEMSAYLTVKGLRDFSYGVLGLVLIAFADPSAVGLYMLVVALNPLGDTLVVLRNGGTKAVAFGIHFATAVAVLVSAGLMFAV
ncbi:DUF4267 domain-containing protein [Actinocorallia sp. A-T 12471]|uniref:DUF4267 domain-containing protein n=1 Tax=Actinocorallia sp. A-T 12471 TaxID=3089813 RepID=UPI0029D284E8|nr:DUF4267 domain-containing protein [Actinocorallia sp. A-T 12471]MDX6738185.1 DUF4267 domain-containing protein [Actinocorallia sp. A-T 12471]